jgi:DNA invertase Pin-like site-specific DNA recombinase
MRARGSPAPWCPKPQSRRAATPEVIPAGLDAAARTTRVGGMPGIDSMGARLKPGQIVKQDQRLCTAIWRFEPLEAANFTRSNERMMRPELIQARVAANKPKATLIVARLDRLSRDLAYIATFLRGERRGRRYVETPFTAVDMPHADRPMLQIMGWFADVERQKISERTRAALAALKARGVTLGSPQPEIGSRAGVAARQARAEAFKLKVRRSIEDIRARGITTLSGIAAELNARGIGTPNGSAWTATQVSRVLA